MLQQFESWSNISFASSSPSSSWLQQLDPEAQFWLLEQVWINILVPCCETIEQINVSNFNVYHIYCLSVTLLLRDKAGFDFKSLDYNTATLQYYNTTTLRHYTTTLRHRRVAEIYYSWWEMVLGPKKTMSNNMVISQSITRRGCPVDDGPSTC